MRQTQTQTQTRATTQPGGDTTPSFPDLVQAHLGHPPGDEFNALLPLATLPATTRRFTERMLALMRHSGHGVEELTPHMGWQLAYMIPSILPDSWGGRIPPITMPGRHHQLDRYVTRRSWPRSTASPLFVDLGCGFPPVTTAETARHLRDWQVIGVDRSFAHYILYDEHGDYACFDREHRFLYFQPSTGGGRWQRAYQNPQAVRDDFRDRFAKLHPLLPQHPSDRSQTIHAPPGTLVRNSILDFHSENLTFREADLTQLDLPPAQVVRCMNVLLYFSPDQRSELTAQAGRLLADGGLLLAGTNGSAGATARYAVYQRMGAALLPVEYAFSLDNLYPVGLLPWFTLHENDPEAWLLADLVQALRTERTFWQPFQRRVQELRAELEVSYRDAAGTYHLVPAGTPPDEGVRRDSQLWTTIAAEGYPEQAVRILGDAGLLAQVNSVGHIAVTPGTTLWLRPLHLEPRAR